jgi:hypothetical protein
MNGYNSDLWMISLTVYSAVILINNLKLAMHVRHWTTLLILSMILTSFMPYLGFVWLTNYFIARYVQRTAIMSFQCILTYCVVILTTVFMMLITSNVIYFLFKKTGLVQQIH